MPSELAKLLITDLPAGLNPMLGVQFIHTPTVGGPPQTLTGIPDFSPEGRSRRDGAACSLWVVLADFTTAPKKLDMITLDGIEYLIADDPNNHLDGIGGAFLVLRKK